MKYILSLLILFLFSNCKAQEVLFYDEEPNEHDLAIISITIGTEMNLITFTANFENEQIEIFANENSIYSGLISTDHTLGAARGVQFNRFCDSIIILINNQKFRLKNSTDYRFIYFEKENEKYNIEYRKKPIKFG